MRKNKIINLSGREDRGLFLLGTASQLPTRRRNPSSALFRWREHGFLLDVGEGTQRQMFRMGLSVADVDHILISHFHGDHVLGLPGVIQSLSLQTEGRSLRIIYPLSGQKFLQSLMRSSVYQQNVEIVEEPVASEGEICQVGDIRIFAYKLKHKTPCWGYILREDDKVKFDPEKIEAVGMTNSPLLKKITLESGVEFEGKTVTFDIVGEKRRGFRFGYIPDTGACPACDIIASGSDVLLCEATYIEEDSETAVENGHLTSKQAALIAARNNVKTLVLTHFSQRYQDREELFLEEAQEVFPNTIMGEDLMTIYA